MTVFFLHKCMCLPRIFSYIIILSNELSNREKRFEQLFASSEPCCAADNSHCSTPGICSFLDPL